LINPATRDVTPAQPNVGHVRLVLSRVHDAVLEEPFRVRLAAGADGPIGSQIKMHQENAVPQPVDVGHSQAAGSGWLALALRPFRAGQTATELPSEGAIEVISLR